MSNAELKAAIERVEQWSAPYRRIGEHQRADDLGRIIAAARSTLDPEPIPTVEFNGHNQDAEPDSGTIYVPLMTGQISVGRLGATVPDGSLFNNQLIAALDMAERRILRLEVAYARLGLRIEDEGLPE